MYLVPHLLHWRTGFDLGAAREKVRVARALATLPHINMAMQRGELSYANGRALTLPATPGNDARLVACTLRHIGPFELLVAPAEGRSHRWRRLRNNASR